MNRSGGGRFLARPGSSLAVLGLLLIGVAGRARAQDRAWIRWSTQAILAWTGADPVPGGGRLDEIRLVQPVGMLHAGWGGHLSLLGTLDLEGLTMPDGELTMVRPMSIVPFGLSAAVPVSSARVGAPH